jgi:serine/threonine protein kinase
MTSPQASLDLGSNDPGPPLHLPCRFGRYRLTRLLATGGMAQIYLAKSFGAEGFVKPLVIKRLDPRLAKAPFFTRLFVSEAKLLVTLSHGNIVPVFDFGRVGDDLYMAMEYVRGASLSEVLQAARQAGQHLDVPLVAHIAAEICKGLDYAHRKANDAGKPAGIVHRDIKPGNILVSYEGEVKIVDFGVAKLASRVETGDHLAGTIAYMSPEQAERKVVDPRTDIFSAGLVLYELVTSERAYNGQSAMEILASARRATIPAIPADVPLQIQEIIHRATQRDILSRYASAHEMEQELAEYLLVARTTDSIETAEVVSPASRLSQIMQALPFTDKGDEALSADLVDADWEWIPGEGTGEESGLIEFVDPPDMSMIQNAAETFHSEFLTRVLEEEQLTMDRTRQRWLLGVGALGLLVLLALVVTVLLWPHGEKQQDVAHKALGSSPPRATASLSSTQRTVDTGRSRGDAQQPTRPNPTIRSSPIEAISHRELSHRSPTQPGTGYLYLNSIPWSDVSIDGKPLGRPTPLLHHKLAAGRHTVVLVNHEHHLRKTLVVKILKGTTTRQVVNLR